GTQTRAACRVRRRSRRQESSSSSRAAPRRAPACAGCRSRACSRRSRRARSRRRGCAEGGRLPYGSRMEERALGRTRPKVSRLALGCGKFGGIGSAPAFFGMGETEDQAFALMDRAFDAGINVFDTADAYGGGRSEAWIGRWLQAKGSRVRDQLVLGSKVF